MKWASFFILFFLSCSNEKSVEVIVNEDTIEDASIDSMEVIISVKSVLEQKLDSIMGLIGLVDLMSIDSTININLKYATIDNFMGVQLYDTLTRLFLQKDVALRLSKSQHFLDSIYPQYSLLVYDGVRPLQVQKEMWDALDSIPVYRRSKFVSNPINGSVHNFGAAVDVTIINSYGNILDMGAGYDDFREIAFPKFESRFLKSGDLTKEQYQNRRLLRKVMQYSGFYNIPSEWWHFNAYSRTVSSNRYKMLLTESGEHL